ncbi:MutS-related protein, partial [Marinimicrobium sp. UBA4209]
ELPGIVNVHLDATEHHDSIVFLHKVQEGPASKSYGLQVAKLAGIPDGVLAQAKTQLAELEGDAQRGSSTPQPPKPEPAPAADTPVQGGLFDSAPHPVVEALGEVQPDDLSPREALEQLYALKALMTGKS